MEALDQIIAARAPESAPLESAFLQEAGATSFVVLSAAGELYAIEIGSVREIIRVPKVTWLPGAPANIPGIINLRGVVVAVVDLAVMLSRPPLETDDGSRIVIVESAGQPVGLLVESVAGVEEIDPSAQEEVMRTLDEVQRAFIASQAEIGGRLAGILDIGRLVEGARPSAAE